MANSRMDVASMLATYAALYGQRLGQFIDNVMTQEEVTVDLFYVEDDKLLELAAIYAVKYPPQVKGMP